MKVYCLDNIGRMNYATILRDGSGWYGDLRQFVKLTDNLGYKITGLIDRRGRSIYFD